MENTICEKCNEKSNNTHGPCNNCIEKIASELNIPEHIIKEYASDTGDNDLSNIEEAYEGKYDNDEEFARTVAENTGTADTYNQPWPQYCIDWKWAADELMQDYHEINGYYFRA